MKQPVKRFWIQLLAVAFGFLGCMSAPAMGRRNPARVSENPAAAGVEQKTVSIRGHVVMYGSEPHTFPGIVTDDGKQYTVQVRQDVLVRLNLEQGKIIVFTGRIVPLAADTASGGAVFPFQTLRDGTFILDSWKPVNK